MSGSQWHKLYTATVAAPPEVLFEVLSDLPDYGRWLPGSDQFGRTTAVEPYPVRLGTRHHDGKPGEPGEGLVGQRDRIPTAGIARLPPHDPRQATESHDRRAHPHAESR